MKTAISLFAILFSAHSFGCKLSQPAYGKLIIESALTEFLKFSSNDTEIKSVVLGDLGAVEVRATNGSVKLRSLFKVTVNPNCSTEVAQVKPGENSKP